MPIANHPAFMEYRCGGELPMRVWTTGLLALGITASFAIPETVVFMPTANRNTPRTLSLAAEQFGVPRFYSETRTRCFYTQFALTERFDFGVDFIGVDSNQSRQTVANARFVISPETKQLPGLSVGVLNLTEDAYSTFYLAGTRSTSIGRFHVGLYRQAERTGWSGAFQTSLAFGLDLAVEYYKFPDGTTYTSFGVGRALSNQVYLYTYYACHHQTRDNDLFGVFLAFAPFRLF
ncbi:MAG: hypothetical protein RMK45_09760 [Armatimonadota bacterium]|nr:hypothetical protein [Armatimonadota bacterium]